MNSLHLASSPFEERHTGESIANGLKVVLERHEVSGEASRVESWAYRVLSMHGLHSELVRQALSGFPRDAGHHQTGTSAGDELQDVYHGYCELKAMCEALKVTFLTLD